MVVKLVGPSIEAVTTLPWAWGAASDLPARRPTVAKLVLSAPRGTDTVLKRATALLDAGTAAVETCVRMRERETGEEGLR
jgi:hypothetical protein